MRQQQSVFHSEDFELKAIVYYNTDTDQYEVDFAKFALEVARLLEVGGRVFVTFDYWSPIVTPPIKMYGLEWQPLDDQALRQFIDICKQHNLYLVQDIDWTLDEAVIRYGYYSPHPDISYTFGLVVFEKKGKQT